MSAAEELTRRLLPLFDAALEGRAAPTRAPEAIVARAADRCFAAVFASSAAPGPLGLLALVPEMAFVAREQLGMLADLALAAGRTDVPKEVLLELMLLGAGGPPTGLLVEEGGRVLVRRASRRLGQKLGALLAGQLLSELVESVLLLAVPIAGASAVGLAMRRSTRALGERALRLYALPFEVDPVEVDGEVPEPPQARRQIAQRVNLLIRLLRVDGEVSPRERELLGPLLHSPDLPAPAAAAIRSALAGGPLPPVDYTVFHGSQAAQVVTLTELVAAARAVGGLDPREREFVLETARGMGFPSGEVERWMDEDPIPDETFDPCRDGAGAG